MSEISSDTVYEGVTDAPVVVRLSLAESAALRLASVFGATSSQMPESLDSARRKLRVAEYAARQEQR